MSILSTNVVVPFSTFPLQIKQCGEIDADNSSDRLRNQIKLFNLVANALRFIGRILIRDIPGRETAERLENEHIGEHVKKYGKRPRGNPPK